MEQRRFVTARVVSVFCFVLLLIAEESMSIQPPTCSFEVGGIERACAKFEPGCITSEYYNDVVSDLEYRSFSRNTINYWNVTFNISFNDGMLKLYKTEDCWTFQMLGSAANFNVSHMKLHFNFIPNNYNHPGFVYRRGDACPLLRANLEVHMYALTRELMVQFHDSKEINLAEVTLMGAECYITCSGDVNSCNLARLDTIELSDLNQQVIFSNLTYGHYYCVRVEGSDDCPAINTKTNQLTLVVNTEKPLDMRRMATVSEMVIIVIVGVGLAASILTRITLKCGRGSSHVTLVTQDEEAQEMMQQWQLMSQGPTVLLLYSRDSPDFCKIMEALSKLLEKCANMEVLDPFDHRLLDEVSRNISGWVMRYLSRSDVKVIIVESEGSYIRQQALLENKRALLVDSHCLDPVFTHALTWLQSGPHLKKDYGRLFRIRFDQFTERHMVLKDIVPLTCFSIFQHLGRLISELKGFPSSSESFMDDLRRHCPDELKTLEHHVFNMEKLLKNNPRHIQMQFMLSPT